MAELHRHKVPSFQYYSVVRLVLPKYVAKRVAWLVLKEAILALFCEVASKGSLEGCYSVKAGDKNCLNSLFHIIFHAPKNLTIN